MNSGPAHGSSIRAEINGHTLLLTIDRPEKLNALDENMVERLETHIEDADSSAAIRAVILTGVGKAFVAGADIGRYDELDAAGFAHFQRKSASLFETIESCSKPVIAAVNGYALGGGLELAAVCDIVVASTTASFGLPETRLGLIPGGGATQRLPLLVGVQQTLRLVLTGDRITAEEAYRTGLASFVVEPSELVESCMKIAERIAQGGPLAIAAAKRAVRLGTSAHGAAGLRLELAELQSLYGSADAAEGIGAFIEKRAPSFTGR